MELPWSTEEIDRACRETLEANGLTDAYMRPVAWRGSEQMGVTAAKATPHLAIACWPWGAYFGDEAIRKGLRLDISPWRRPAPYTAPTDSKASGLYMICTMARQAAEVRGYDDASCSTGAERSPRRPGRTSSSSGKARSIRRPPTASSTASRAEP
jgi:branched-chain amino acid aminotransferase